MIRLEKLYQSNLWLSVEMRNFCFAIAIAHHFLAILILFSYEIICRTQLSMYIGLTESEFVQPNLPVEENLILLLTWALIWNSQVTGEFPAQKPVTWSFDVFFDLRLNKRLSKQSWGWWFETPSRSLWRHFKEKLLDIYNTSVAGCKNCCCVLPGIRTICFWIPLCYIFNRKEGIF